MLKWWWLLNSYFQPGAKSEEQIQKVRNLMQPSMKQLQEQMLSASGKPTVSSGSSSTCGDSHYNGKYYA